MNPTVDLLTYPKNKIVEKDGNPKYIDSKGEEHKEYPKLGWPHAIWRSIPFRKSFEVNTRYEPQKQNRVI